VTATDSSAGRSRTAAARALSILGHPALLLPAAGVFGAARNGAPPAVLRAVAAVSLAVAAAVMVYSLVQVRAGRWSHVDASVPRERNQLNLVLALLLLGAAGALWWLGEPLPLFASLAVAGALVVLAALLRHWLKVSLHAGFAVLAAAFVWPSLAGTAAVLALAAGVAWSRLVLARHTPAEIAVGMALGAAAAVAFRLAVP